MPEVDRINMNAMTVKIIHVRKKLPAPASQSMVVGRRGVWVGRKGGKYESCVCVWGGEKSVRYK